MLFNHLLGDLYTIQTAFYSFKCFRVQKRPYNSIMMMIIVIIKLRFDLYSENFSINV